MVIYLLLGLINSLINLFLLNQTLDKFVSLINLIDLFILNQAIDVDAFSLSWTNLKLYTFPPFSCISQCLQKITMEKATGVIAAPNRTTQPFYSALLRMLVKGPIVIKKNKPNLIMPRYHKMK